MKSTPVIAIFLALILACPAWGQVKCGFEVVTEKAAQQSPAYRRSLETIDKDLLSVIRTQVAQRGGEVLSNVYTIPCVVHIIHTGGAVGSNYNPTDAQIQNALLYLNSVYDGTWEGAGGTIQGVGDIQIRFVLATRDPSNNSTTGINRVNGTGVANYSANGMKLLGATGANELSVKNLSRWDPFKYYNIWVVNKIDGCDGYSGCGSFVGGFAYFPFPANDLASTRDLDGTVMLASQMMSGKKTLPHEIGHALNLYHPFQGETVLPGQNACPPNSPTDGDACADTNPITNPADDGEASPFNCRSGPGCYGNAYNDNTERNFMNYTNCFRLFTSDQKNRMLASSVSTMRSSLVSSWANNESSFPVSWAAPVAPAVTPASLNVLSDVAGISYITLNNRTTYSLNATQDGGYLNNAAKWYNLFHLQRNTSYTLTVKLTGANSEQLGVWIDYNNDGVFNNTNEQIYLQTDISQVTATSPINITFTTPSSSAGGILRMRIMEDLSTIYGVSPLTSTTGTLIYGQAEDYPLYIQGGSLPLTLLDFKGRVQSRAVNLEWKTTNEVNMQNFEVERAIEGSGFQAIGKVDALNTGGQNNYSFSDRQTTTGVHTYRLKMINTDGSYTYSRIIAFKLDNSLPPDVVANPFGDKIRMQLPASTGKLNFRLFDATGRTLLNRELAGTNGSSFELDVSMLNLSRGVYVLESVINGERFTNKLFKE